MSDSLNDIRAIVRRAHDAWNAAFNRGDAAGVAALYTQNATLLPPTHSVIKGTAAIRDFWQGLLTAGFKDHGIEMLEPRVRVVLQSAVESGGPTDRVKAERCSGSRASSSP